MAMTEAEHREMMRTIDARRAKRTRAQAAYEAALRRRIERGDTVVEHAFGSTTRYSLHHPGAFVKGAKSPAEMARHLAARKHGFGTRITFEKGVRDKGSKRRDPSDRRFWYSIWGRSPGFGYESGWTFARTPKLAVETALADASRYSGHKWRLPANVYLKNGESFAFYVSADGTIVEGQGPSGDPRKGTMKTMKRRRDVRSWYGRARTGAKKAYGHARTGYGKAKHHAGRAYSATKQHAGRASAKAKSAYASTRRHASIASKHYGAMRQEMRTSGDPSSQKERAYLALQHAAERIARAEHTAGRYAVKRGRTEKVTRGYTLSEEHRRVLHAMNQLGADKITPEQAMAVLHEHDVLHARTRDRHKAARIPKGQRAATSREIRSLVSHGYSPRYAARKAYHEHQRDKLSASELRGVPARMFALPSRRQLPLVDKSHVRNAAARLEQMRKRGTVTSNEYKTAHARILRAERVHGIKHHRRHK